MPVTAAGIGRADRRRAADRPRPRRDADVRRQRAARHGRNPPPHRARRCPPAQSLTISSDLSRTSCPAPARSRCRSRRSARSTCRRCCRRSTAIPMAAPSRRSAARCRCSTSTSSRQPAALALDGELGRAIRDAIDSVLARQDANGAFGLWSADSARRSLARRLRHRLPDPRPRRRIIAVPQKAFDQALDRLRNRSSTPATSKHEQGAPTRLCDLCAGAQRPAGDGRSALSRRHQARRVRHAARARAARRGARVARRQGARADRVRRRRARNCARAQANRFSRSDYGSRLRDGAGLLALAAETGADRALIRGRGDRAERAQRDDATLARRRELDGARRRRALAEQAQNMALTVDGAAAHGPALPHLARRALDAGATSRSSMQARRPRSVVLDDGGPTRPGRAAAVAGL